LWGFLNGVTTYLYSIALWPRNDVTRLWAPAYHLRFALKEVFHAKPGEVEEMIQVRLEESQPEEEREEGLWPREFCLGE
jgi:hypothetical protein